MKSYGFYINDRHGVLYHVFASEFRTKQGGTATVFYARLCWSLDATPLMYVRYQINKPGTGAVYHEYNYASGHFVERVSIRRFFPSWDMRKIRKEWRCLNG